MISRIKGKSLTPPQYLASGFAIIILIGSILLTLPAASEDGRSLHWIDALFTAASATCVTGLVVVDTGTQFSLFGEIVILVLIQLGGLGFMTSVAWFAMLLRKRITLRERLIMKESINQENVEGVVRLIRKVLYYSLAVEGAAALCYTFRWMFDMPIGQAAYYGLFHAVSVFNNAGFDLFGGFRSMTPFVNDAVVNLVSIVITILGGIGFIVMSDLIEYPKMRKLSLHSKVVLAYTGILFVIGALVIFVFEFTNAKTLGPLHEGYKVLASLFQSASTRSSGVSTIDIAGLREATQFFMILLMFIGAAPGSTGGGIKITTFAILSGAMAAMIRGKEDVVMFRRTLPREQVYKAITIALFGTFLVVLSAMVLSATERQPLLAVLFEVTSAFGTVGLSMGLTPELTAFGKLLLILLMFTGRLGAFTLAYALQPKKKKELFHYPEEKIIIG